MEIDFIQELKKRDELLDGYLRHFVNMDDLPNHIDTLLLWVFFAFAALL